MNFELVASDQERLIVDAFIRYRIVDGVKFYQALQTERGAQLQLQSIMDSTLRDVLGRVDRPKIKTQSSFRFTALWKLTKKASPTGLLGLPC